MRIVGKYEMRKKSHCNKRQENEKKDNVGKIAQNRMVEITQISIIIILIDYS